MATEKDFINEVLELLSPIGGITSKSMFGGYGVFNEGKMFALVKGNDLFFKVDSSNLPDYEKAGSPQYKPMPYYKVPSEVFVDPSSLREWAGKSVKIAHMTPAKKK